MKIWIGVILILGYVTFIRCQNEDDDRECEVDEVWENRIPDVNVDGITVIKTTTVDGKDEVLPGADQFYDPNVAFYQCLEFCCATDGCTIASVSTNSSLAGTEQDNCFAYKCTLTPMESCASLDGNDFMTGGIVIIDETTTTSTTAVVETTTVAVSQESTTTAATTQAAAEPTQAAAATTQAAAEPTQAAAETTQAAAESAGDAAGDQSKTTTASSATTQKSAGESQDAADSDAAAQSTTTTIAADTAAAALPSTTTTKTTQEETKTTTTEAKKQSTSTTTTTSTPAPAAAIAAQNQTTSTESQQDNAAATTVVPTQSPIPEGFNISTTTNATIQATNVTLESANTTTELLKTNTTEDFNSSSENATGTLESDVSRENITDAFLLNITATTTSGPLNTTTALSNDTDISESSREFNFGESGSGYESSDTATEVAPVNTLTSQPPAGSDDNVTPLPEVETTTMSPSNESLESADQSDFVGNETAANNPYSLKVARFHMAPALIAAVTFGVMFSFAVFVLVGKRCYDSYQRRHYQKIDYLVNGMYN